MSWGYVPLEITTGILPAPGGSVSYLEEAEFPTSAGLEMAIKNQLGYRTYHSKVVLPKPYSQQSSWEWERSLDLGEQQPGGDGFKARMSTKKNTWYLQPTVDLCDV